MEIRKWTTACCCAALVTGGMVVTAPFAAQAAEGVTESYVDLIARDTRPEAETDQSAAWEAQIDLASDTAVVGLSWETTAQPTVVSYRLNKDGQWGTWNELAREWQADATEPLVITDAQSVELRVVADHELVASDFSAVVIDPRGGSEVANTLVEETEPASPGDGLGGELEQEALPVDPASFDSQEQEAPPIPPLSIRSRSTWDAGAEDFASARHPKVRIHHTAGSTDYREDQVRPLLHALKAYSSFAGADDIPYDLIVDSMGEVWQGGNSNSADPGAVLVLGDFSKTPPEQALLVAVAQAVESALSEEGTDSDIIAACNAEEELCSSDGLYSQIPLIRQLVTQLRVDPGPPAEETEEPAETPDSLEEPSQEKAVEQAEPLQSSLSATGTSQQLARTVASTWDPSNIISDRVFYNAGAMSESQIKSFIETQGIRCSPNAARGTRCLKDMVFPTQRLEGTRGACKPLTLSGNQRPWTIIYRTAQACGINPQVLLGTLQKESSGLTQPRTDRLWAQAMGAGCPDGSGCSPAQAGFAKQIYFGADMLAGYRVNPTWEKYMIAFRDKKPVSIPHNPDSKCGSQTLLLKNNATASLYMYTPYIGGSSVSGCGAIGNRLFFNVMDNWFPGSVGTNEPTRVVTTPRTYGSDRFETAVKISRIGFPKKADTVYLANGYSPVDAMVAGTVTDGPVLLTRTDSIPETTKAEIDRLGAKKVVAIGGTSVISDSVLTSLKVPTQRLGGDNRFATAVAVSQHVFPDKAGAVYVADYWGTQGMGSPDAVAGANVGNGPILLSRVGGPVDPQTAAEIKRLGGKVYELGAKNLGTGGTKLAGADRYATAVAIARHAYPASANTVYLVRGDELIDAVAAGTLTKGPRLLLNPKEVSPVVCDYLRNSPATVFEVLSGPQIVSDRVLQDIRTRCA